MWWLACQTANTKKRLNRVQRLACLGITEAIRTTPTGAMEALTGLPPLELVIQGEARSAAHRLLESGIWSYVHRRRGRSSVLMRLQRSDLMFNIGTDVIRLAFNPEPKYRFTVLTRESGAEDMGLFLWLKGSSGSQTGPGRRRRPGLASVGRRLSISLEKFSRLRFMPSWSVYMKFKQMLG